MSFDFVAENGEKLNRGYGWLLPDPPELVIEPPLTKKEIKKGRYTLTGRAIVGMPDLPHDPELTAFFKKHKRLLVK